MNRVPQVTAGADKRLTAPEAVGGGLVHEDALVHLAAFNLPAGDRTRDRNPRFEQAMTRRRQRMRS